MDSALDQPEFSPTTSNLKHVTFESPHGPWSVTSRESCPDLAGSVVEVWETIGYCDYSREKLMPSGKLDLIFNLGGPHQTLDATSLLPIGTYSSAWLSGFQQSAIIAAPTYNSLQHGSWLIGVRLNVGGFRKLLGLGGKSFTGNVVELADFLPNALVEDTRNRLAATDRIEKRFEVLEGFIRRLKGDRARRISPYVALGIQAIDRLRGRASVEAICANANVSRKHLNQLFQSQLGISPKKYARVVRFASLIDDVAMTNQVNWTVISAKAGYYDQSHFVRDFRTFTGLTPTEFLQSRSADGKSIIYE